MQLNASTLNGAMLNGRAGSSLRAVVDWSLLAPIERQTIYVLAVGDERIPISSAQATMRSDGQSYLQAVVPNAGDWIDTLAAVKGSMMRLRKGFRYADGSLSPLEAIAEAPFEQLRGDEGANSYSATLSGYGAYKLTTMSTRQLAGVQYRSMNDGVRRVRAEIDLFLRPGHQAIDADGVQFAVGTIQYFINTARDFMEVLQDG